MSNRYDFINKYGRTLSDETSADRKHNRFMWAIFSMSLVMIVTLTLIVIFTKTASVFVIPLLVNCIALYISVFSLRFREESMVSDSIIIYGKEIYTKYYWKT